MNLFLISYVLIGAAVAVWFLASGLKKRDPNAAGTGWAFRLMVFPCCILIWPVLLLRYRGNSGAPMIMGEWRHADLRARRRHALAWSVLPIALLLLFILSLALRTPYKPLP